MMDATDALRAQLSALIDGWRGEVSERRKLRDSMATEGNHAYQDGYAAGVDGCVHALAKLLPPSPASDEELIRDAMVNPAQPGRAVTR